MYDAGEHTVAAIAETLGTSTATVYRELGRA
ncbi:helix-turn-helix domain-containing protein [Streptosporangiaceae bacterium NEAU-GS5]|nr:helix-turn-helix domain-containing protein [Streptosporangiaceae bacterium NEAU-GS5]